MTPELLAMLLAAKAQMEEDAVKLDGSVGWCRKLDALIEQDAMPKAWEELTAYLRRHAPESMP